MDEECINCRVPTFGEFVPRLKISATFGEKSGDFFSVIAYVGFNWETLWSKISV